MNQRILKTSITLLLLISLLSFRSEILAQNSVTMKVQNAVQVAPNIFEYDVLLTNTGSAVIGLRGYSCGINHAAGMNGAGVISHTFISRDPLLAALPAVSPGYTASTNHLRLTTVNAALGSEVNLAPGVSVRLATMRVTNSVNFPTNFDPAFNLQLIAATGKTALVATCIVTPPGTSYVLNAPGNPVTSSSLQILTGVLNTPCFYLNRSSVFVATKTASTSIPCYGQSNGTAQITLSGTGTSSTGLYSVDGGTNITYGSNPFTISNISSGSHVIQVTTNSGCTDTANVNISTPSGSSSAAACNSYTWNGITYTTSGIYTQLIPISTGCDSLHTLNLTINYSTNSTQNVTAANTYTWAVNNVTYTNTGIYTFTTNNAGCISTYTLNLHILKIVVSTDQNISCHGSHDGTLFASVTGGNGNYTFDIDGGTVFANYTGYFFNLAPGPHTVCATQTGSGVYVCGSSVVLEPDPLTATFTIDSVATCVGNHGQLSIDINGGSPISQPYLTLWTNANGDTLNEQSTNNFATTVGSLPSGVYHVRIEDDNGCVIYVDTTLAPAICGSTLNLTAFIEGYYMTSSTMASVLFNEGVTSNQSVTDTIKVVLHNSVSPFSVVASAAAVLNTNGTASCFFPGISGSYYIAIQHRNAVETWSANPVLFNAPTINYDFSTNANKAFGDNMISVDPGVWALYSGDISADQNIDLLDLAILEADINSFQFGYFATDINGDGNVDLLDAPLLEDNINNFIFSVHP